ncbi:hypothetical protein GCM10010844_44040 [Deinococcus radiotolerans]|uniref:Uncharacterized protein n=1 Tax=Deinococcus radiotolerans TaxID=1309407 RepID=A0ABQ2FRZ7_9DEIO|nr:hypothetical protein GCM10010844_44040 [Deinococcus radiotolerans]
MLELQGTYTASPNKRLVILALPVQPVSGVWAADLAALSEVFETRRGCEVRFRSPFGWMEGVLKEKNALRDRQRSFEGYVWFRPSAPRDDTDDTLPPAAVTSA